MHVLPLLTRARIVEDGHAGLTVRTVVAGELAAAAAVCKQARARGKS